MIFSKKTSFLPLLIILRLQIPFLAFAQTKEMTTIGDDDTNLQNQSQEQTTISQDNEKIAIGKKPLPTVSEEIKAKRLKENNISITQDNTDPKQDETESLQQDNEQFTEFDIPNVDTKRVQAAWIEMINSVRSEKAGDYTLDNDLISSSTERANYLGKNKQIDKINKLHRRPNQVCKNKDCYDLGDRFSDRSISASAGESIGYGGYSCKQDDCTDELIEASKKTFRFFMSEAKRNGPHYRMVVSGRYSKVGIGIAQTRASRGNAYVLVMHVSN